jgi:hypothetical protein
MAWIDAQEQDEITQQHKSSRRRNSSYVHRKRVLGEEADEQSKEKGRRRRARRSYLPKLPPREKEEGRRGERLRLAMQGNFIATAPPTPRPAPLARSLLPGSRRPMIGSPCGSGSGSARLITSCLIRN